MTRLPRRLVSAATSIAVLLAATGGSVAAAQDDAVAPADPDPFYCGERKLGTWFYCERPRPEKAPEAAAPAVPAAARMKAIGEQLDELKARAILEPTGENVSAYITFQREQLDRASTFADMWSRAVWQNPALDYTLQRPVNSLGKRAWTDQRRVDQRSTMAALSQRYGVFYFYSSSCGACEIFSPILRSLSDQYSISVLPVSMDGGPNQAFPDYVVNSGQYQKMGLEGGTVPALVLFDTVTKQPIPIGYGVMSADEVMERIFTLTNVKPGSDY